MTSLADVVDLNGNIFGRTICPFSFVVIALIFSELGGGGIRKTLIPSSGIRGIRKTLRFWKIQEIQNGRFKMAPFKSKRYCEVI